MPTKSKHEAMACAAGLVAALLEREESATGQHGRGTDDVRSSGVAVDPDDTDGLPREQPSRGRAPQRRASDAHRPE